MTGDISKLTLTEEQAKALHLLQSGRNVFLTGKAGTGKSVLVQFFRAWAQSQRKLVAVCAPTGFAARNVNGVTLHRFARLPHQPVEPFRSNKSLAAKRSSPFFKAEIVIIDEISMCRADSFQYFFNTLTLIPKAKQVVVVGDFFQLPPVVTPNDRKALEKTWGPHWKSEFAFDTEAWKKLDFVVIKLETILRQDKSQELFIRVLDGIRLGDWRALNWINANAHQRHHLHAQACHDPKAKPEHVLEICPRNVTVNEINYAKLARLKGPEYEIDGEVTGDFPEADMPVERIIRLKSGARVMAVANDPELAFMNGDLGYVYFTGKGGSNTGQITVEFDDGRTVCFRENQESAIKRFKWSNNEYAVADEEIEREVEREVYEVVEGKLVSKIVKQNAKVLAKSLRLKEIGSFTQLPLKLAYAITIHKSQGQTFQKAIVHSGMFSSGQLYTALSRLSTIDGLYLHVPLRNYDLLTNERVREFDRTCKPVDLRSVSAKPVQIPEQAIVPVADWQIPGMDEVILSQASKTAASLGLTLENLLGMIVRRLASCEPDVRTSLFVFLGIREEAKPKESSQSFETEQDEQKLEFLAYIRDNCINSLLSAKSWPELHKVCEQWGIEVRERGGGFVFVAKKNGVMVKASSVHRSLSGKHIQERIGVFCQS